MDWANVSIDKTVNGLTEPSWMFTDRRLQEYRAEFGVDIQRWPIYAKLRLLAAHLALVTLSVTHIVEDDLLQAANMLEHRAGMNADLQDPDEKSEARGPAYEYEWVKAAGRMRGDQPHYCVFCGSEAEYRLTGARIQPRMEMSDGPVWETFAVCAACQYAYRDDPASAWTIARGLTRLKRSLDWLDEQKKDKKR